MILSGPGGPRSGKIHETARTAREAATHAAALTAAPQGEIDQAHRHRPAGAQRHREEDDAVGVDEVEQGRYRPVRLIEQKKLTADERAVLKEILKERNP